MLTAQKESNRQLRQKLGLPEPELSVLTLALAKWEFPAPEFLPAPELEVPPPELEVQTLELESPTPRKEGLLLATEKGEEVTPQPRPPPLCHSPTLVGAVPCPVLPDTLPECSDLLVLGLETRSVHHQAQLFSWAPTLLHLKPKTSLHGRQTSQAFPLPYTSPRRELYDYNSQMPWDCRNRKHLRSIKPSIKAGEALQSELFLREKQPYAAWLTVQASC
ncbi:UNVERIFIED_CONTAM: hypothetical protein FKN15_062181 [Acipenser sinensis]